MKQNTFPMPMPVELPYQQNELQGQSITFPLPTNTGHILRDGILRVCEDARGFLLSASYAASETPAGTLRDIHWFSQSEVNTLRKA